MKTLAILASMAAAVQAVAFTNTEFNVQLGVPFTLTWSGAVGDVKILLETGPNQQSLNPVLTITTAGTGGAFTWTPPASLPSGPYAFEIIDSTNNPNWSLTFNYVGSSSATPLSSLSTTTTSGSTTSHLPTTTTSASTTTTTTTSASSSTITTTSTSSSTTSGTPTNSTTSATTSPSSKPNNTNSGDRLGSPLALILVTVAILSFFH